TVPPAFCPLVSTMSPYSTISLSFYSSRSPPHPHPFPTRRSSDLPIDKAFDAFFHGHLRPIPHRSGQRRDIGLGIRHITRLQRQRSEEHTSELQSRFDLVCRLLLEKKNTTQVDAELSISKLYIAKT